MKSRRLANPKGYVRAVVAIALLVSWSLAVFTGFLLWFAPTGPRTGRLPLLLALTRHQWGDIHFITSVIAFNVTIIHLVVDWRALRAVIGYLVIVHRQNNLLE